MKVEVIFCVVPEKISTEKIQMYMLYQNAGVFSYDRLKLLPAGFQIVSCCLTDCQTFRLRLYVHFCYSSEQLLHISGVLMTMLNKTAYTVRPIM